VGEDELAERFREIMHSIAAEGERPRRRG
jgi:hypothetical protein